MPIPRASRTRSWRILALVLFAAPAFAGCSGKSFFVDVPLWDAGYAWEYDEQEIHEAYISGEPAPGIEELAEDDADSIINRTLRLEVFNSTAASVEGIPIYALAVLQRYVPDEEEAGDSESDFWDAWVFSEDLNLVEPTYVDWRNSEVQLSGNDAQTEEPEATEEPTETTDEDNEGSGGRPENEFRRLDWPLERGHSWRHEEPIDLLGGEPGVFDARATKLVTARGYKAFPAVRIEATLRAYDLSEVEAGIKDSLEAEGGVVRRLNFDFVVEYTYSYSQEVMNFVDYKEVQSVVLDASGKDGDGNNFDFTFEQTVTITRVLARHQLFDGVEKPLTFAVDVKRGVYSPKPITPASHLAVEILAKDPELNKWSEDKMTLGVRIYNSSAGERRVRAPEASYPADAPFAPVYDHDSLEIVWVVYDINAKREKFEAHRFTGDSLTMGGKDFARAGLKQIEATLKLKDAEVPGTEIFTDSVSFEVYAHTNVTSTRATANVTDPSERIRVRFPVEATVTRVYSAATLQGQTSPQQACPVGGGPQNDCLRVADSGDRRVVDQRAEVMKFESSSLGQYQAGDWRFDYGPSAPGQTVTFEIVVRYRPGA